LPVYINLKVKWYASGVSMALWGQAL